jgi:hypothetical protein
MPKKILPKVQAAEVDYELHTLGWKAFQQLCVSITGEMWGQVVQGFFDSHDGGRDGAFHGMWIPTSGEPFQGSFTSQCKFTAKANKTLQLAELGDELEKARRLATRGLADNYFLFTNSRLTGSSDEKIKAAFEAVPGIKRFTAYGADRISQFIRESSRLRMLVPRVYGLGDLSQILDERAYSQAQEILSAIGDDLAKFVITDAYRKSAKALVDHGFVILLGEPACGKSMIAAALAVGALDEWGCSTVKVRDADDFVRHSNPNEPKQFFWVDDAFGATQHDWQSTVGWNRAFPHINAAIRRGARFVFTSRDYIYRSAQNLLKESALPVLRESQVVIHVEQLSKEEREQILYNHIRCGMQPNKFKHSTIELLPAVAVHPRFSPEIARRLGHPTFTKQLRFSPAAFEKFVAEPMELLREIICTLDANALSAIALVFMSGGALPSPLSTTPEEERAIELLGGSPAEVRNSLMALNGSLLIQVRQGANYFWSYKHPTIRDAFAAHVSENRELLDIYLMGTPLRQLFAEITCGDVGLEGVKVVIPEDRYHLLLGRIQTFLADRRENRDAVNRFFSARCESEFLARFLAMNSGFLGELRAGIYVEVVSDVGVVVRLHKFGLLPESERLRHVARISEVAIETPDAGFLREDIRTLFDGTELNDLLENVRLNLLPELSYRIDQWADEYNGEDDPEAHFSLLRSAFRELRDAFYEDMDAHASLEAGLANIDRVIEELQSKLPDDPDRDDFFGETGKGGDSDTSRSVFDDVDQ